MWNEHLGQLNIAKHRIELSLADAKQIHYAPYRAGPKVPEFEQNDIDKMLSRVIEPAQTDSVAPRVFVPKQYGSLRFLVQ